VTGDGRVRAAYLYPNSRLDLAAAVATASAPDTALLGQNHLAAFGIDARIHEPRGRRRDRGGGLLHRLTWNMRELAAAWDLRDDDIALTPLANLFPLVARAARGPRVVLFDWGLRTALARASGRRRSLLRSAVRSTAAILCPSPSQRADVIEAFGLSESRVHMIELGVDERFFTTSATPTEDFVLAVGKDLARDYRTLAAATAAGGFRTILVAHPRNVEGLLVPPSLEIRHGLNWDELRDLYARAACVVLPLRDPRAPVGTDGSGLTAVLEAMASGKAVVATKRPALETYVEDGRTGVLVAAEEPDELAAAVMSVLENPAAATAMGSAARQDVEKRLTTRALASRLAPLLLSLGSGEG
jgi:glycosyltransferase involved in cell wall biosynthesis